MSLTDSHAHLDMYPAEDLPPVLARAYAAGVRTILAIGIGDGPHQMHRALEIATSTNSPELPTIYASAGIHPQEAANATPENLAKLTTLAANPRCVAIGEIGLDYYHVENPTPDIQQAAFLAQLRIAAQAAKPILIPLPYLRARHSAGQSQVRPRRRLARPPHPAHGTLAATLARHQHPGRHHALLLRHR
jgi:TatD DNase family protein